MAIRQGVPVSHAGRNVALAFLVFLILLIVFFAVPVVTVASVNVPYGVGSISVSATGSLSYAVFHCGEVHVTGYGEVLGRTVASVDRYEWICGGSSPPATF